MSFSFPDALYSSGYPYGDGSYHDEGDGSYHGEGDGCGYGNGRWNGFYSKEPFHTGSGHDIYYACYPDEIIIGKVD